MSTIDEAIFALRRGRFVLVHDDKNRENEIDMIVAGENITPRHVATMRNDAGGLLCLAIDGLISKKLGLSYLHDILNSIPNTNNLFQFVITTLKKFILVAQTA